MTRKRRAPERERSPPSFAAPASGAASAGRWPPGSQALAGAAQLAGVDVREGQQRDLGAGLLAGVVDARLPADQPDRLQQVKPTERAGVMSVAVSEAIIVKAAMSSAPRSAQTLGTRFGMRDVAAGRR
jgi:hypothetical protein